MLTRSRQPTKGPDKSNAASWDVDRGYIGIAKTLPDEPEKSSVHFSQVLDAALRGAKVVVWVVLGGAATGALCHGPQHVELVIGTVQHLQTRRLQVSLMAPVR